MVANLDPAPSRAIPTTERRIHHRHSAQSIAVSLASRLIVKNVVRAWAIQPNLHWPLETVDVLAGLLPRSGPAAEIERIELDNCPAERIRSAGASGDRAILYLHGGAFFTCGLNTHRSFATRLSKAADACVLNVGYRLLPSHQISDAIDDGISALRWLRRRGYDGERIVIAGDSAGGYLAFMTALQAIQDHIAHPAGVATISPFTDPDPARKLCHRNANRCSMFTRRALTVFDRYLQQAQLWDRPDHSSGRALAPVDADLSVLPPVTIHASSDELLCADAELMAERLGDAGIRCDLHLWDGQIHDFPIAADVLPEGRRAIRYIGDFVKEVTAEPDELRSRRQREPRARSGAPAVAAS
jgi:acetyl esterase/lipase